MPLSGAAFPPALHFFRLAMLSDTSSAAEKFSACFDHDGDWQIVVKSTAPDPQPVCTFRVWSTLLAAWSDVFAAMLRPEWLEAAHGTIEIIDFSASAVESFLRFLYSGTLNIPNDEPTVFVEVTALADKYAVVRLRELCVSHFVKLLKPQNSCEVLRGIDSCGLALWDDLRERCLEMIRRRAKDALPRAIVLTMEEMEEVGLHCKGVRCRSSVTCAGHSLERVPPHPGVEPWGGGGGPKKFLCT